jgi:hypothetical protein
MLLLPIARSSQPAPRFGTAQASGDKAKARDIIAPIRALKTLEWEKRTATPQEKLILARFAGFGPVALSIFPDPVSGRYKDAGWAVLGQELQALLMPEEYASAKRTTFNAFYTSPTVIAAMHEAIHRLAVPADGRALEPGYGTGISWPRRPRPCALSASRWTRFPAASPARCTLSTTSASKTSGTQSSPKAVSTR